MRQLAPPLEHQRQQRGGHAQHRDHDGDELQRVGDGEGAVEDAQHFGAQRPVGVDEGAVAVVEAVEDLAAHGSGSAPSRR